MNCRVCGNSLFVGRTVFRCACGAFTHAGCWERHVVEAHKPPFVLGTISLNGDFVPRKSRAGVKESLAEGEPAGVK